jgi:hypothetical protein
MLMMCAACSAGIVLAQETPRPLEAQTPPLLSSAIVGALDQELSGETAKRNLEGITREHRVRGSRGFRAAAELVLERAKAYGLTDAQILEFPADGRTFYGTQKSRRAWDAEFAELWELREQGGAWVPTAKLADWSAMPVTLAEDSESGDVTAELVDVGEGTRESDYAGKDVHGKLVLVAAQPGGVQHLAVELHGAAGIVSYAQNQRSAWWGEDENLIRWGHLESFGGAPTFAFMVSLKTARGLRERLGRGEPIHMHAVVRAGQHPGVLSVVTATIPGGDPKLRDEEIAFSCHLDHQRPGANDNASGCVTILEVARTLQKLIAAGTLPRPARTLRFIWPPEIEGTTTLLNAKPEFAQRIKAVIHMDMVGGNAAITKSIFHVTRGPMSLPSFVYDVGAAFGEFVNQESALYAGTGEAEFPFVAPEGGKEALQAEMVDYSMGSDHDVYEEGAFRIPAIYMNDYPDRYIHTDGDVAANIDPTKLKRAGFIGAASGYFLAQMNANDAVDVIGIVKRAAVARLMRREDDAQSPGSGTWEGVNKPFLFRYSYENEVLASVKSFAPLNASALNETRLCEQLFRSISAPAFDGNSIQVLKTGSPETFVYERIGAAKGPMAVFGYDYFSDHSGGDSATKLGLFKYQGLRGSGSEYAYEVLVFVDGKRGAKEIRDRVSIEYGPVPFDLVAEYLRALESIGVIKKVK